jgi:enterochelin esterase family protein
MDAMEKDRAFFAANMELEEPYTLGADSFARPGVPCAAISKHHWVSRSVYPGTERDYWLYVPQQYDAATPACLMVFQDGDLYLGPQVNAGIVMDNLIHAGEIPVIIGLFVAPGDRGPGNRIYGGTDNRSYEYDSLGDRYARFLIEELLPEVERRYNITADPGGRAICGFSSGGICAFTAAWERPDAFGKIVSHCGSFADMNGGYVYPKLIRQTEAKPLRVFLQSGARDLDIFAGSWPLGNQDVAAALAYREYDHQFVYGEGGHTLKHAASIFPDTLRWLWRP